MSFTRKTITVTDKQDNWIKAQTAAELIEGENSGDPQPFNGDLFKKEMIKKHGKSKE